MKTVMVILNYNDYNTTSDYLELIGNYKCLDYIIVVDNNSTDNSYQKLLKYNNKKIKVLKSDKNGGYGYGNNIGIKYAIKKYGKCNIIISNPDIVVKDEVIEELSKVLNSNDHIAIAAPVVKENGKLNRGWKLSSGGKELLLSLPKIGTNFRDKIVGYKYSYYNNNELSKVDVVSGCFFMIKSEVFKKIGLFDEHLFLYYEENVIAKKIKDLGYISVVVNNCNIIHNHSVSIDKTHNNLNKYKILKESQMYYLNNYTNANYITKKIIKLISNLMIRNYEKK